MSFSPGPALELAYSQRTSNQGGLISEGNVESNSSGTSLSPKATNPLVRSSHQESQTPTTAAAGATAAAPLRSRVRCKPLPRKGHKKSRKGCLTCKSRRVKCTETFPECGPCVRLNLPCTWPDNNTLMEDEGRTHAEEAVSVATEAVPNRVYTTTTSWQGPQGQGQGQGQGQQQQQLQRRPSPVESTPLRSTRGVLAMEDLHLFHHFLFFAYPPLPSEGSSIWRNVSAMSHKYEFLAHAILGHAASHLSWCGEHNSNYSEQALAHRVKAISHLNAALSKPCVSPSDVEARFATAFILAFQASHLPDGIYDFISMLRGCFVVSGSDGIPAMFSAFEMAAQQAAAPGPDRRAKLGEEIKDRLLIDGYLKSMEDMSVLCKTPIEKKFHEAIAKIVKRAEISAAVAFSQLCSVYVMIATTSVSDSAFLVDPSSAVGQLLLAHLFLSNAVVQISTGSLIGPHHKVIILNWVGTACEALPQMYKKYTRWPLAAVEIVKSDGWLPQDKWETSIPGDWKRLRLSERVQELE